MALGNTTKINSTCEKLSIRIIRVVRIIILLLYVKGNYKSSHKSVQDGLKTYHGRYFTINTYISYITSFFFDVGGRYCHQTSSLFNTVHAQCYIGIHISFSAEHNVNLLSVCAILYYSRPNLAMYNAQQLFMWDRKF